MVDLTMRSSSLPCFLLVLLISLQTSVIESNVHDVCGFPGLPSNGSLDSTTSLLFSAGQEVTYKCQEAFVLFGPDKRICQGNGSWSPVSLPECRENVAVGKSSLQSSTLWNYHPDLAVDANPDTCSFTPRSGEQRWWQVHLGGDGINVQSVAITLSPGSYQKFTIFIIQLLEGNKAMYKPCSKFDGKFETKKAVFLCNDGLGHPGQFVYIRDDRKEQEYFGLCEVEVFEYRNETMCGDPEQPLYSTIQRLSDQSIVYACLKGYKMEAGDPRRDCVNGVWTGPPPPRCSEVLCEDPLSVKDGFIEVTNFKGQYVYGSVATYHCNPGYILWGNASRLCAQDGAWTGTQPQCKTISCGQPPEVANAHYRLANGTSTTWLSLAVYFCQPGHRMVHHQHGKNDTHQTMAMCSDQGIWQPVNFECIFDPLAVNLKDGANYDWTTAFEDNGSMKIGTFITIGALGALVLLVVVIVVIFFWQRHGSPLDASSSPVSPKISRSSTNQLIADVAKGLASHFDSPEPNVECYASFRPTTNLTVPTDYCGRSAGDGGSEEGNYSSLRDPTGGPDDSHYAMVRQPDGRADEPCYSSLRERPNLPSDEGDGGYESLQHRQPIYAGISSPAVQDKVIYESLPRSHSGTTGPTTKLVGIQGYGVGRTSSLRRKDTSDLYAQVDRSKKKRAGGGGGESSSSLETCSPISNPLRTLLDEAMSTREPLYATIGHKPRPNLTSQQQQQQAATAASTAADV